MFGVAFISLLIKGAKLRGPLFYENSLYQLLVDDRNMLLIQDNIIRGTNYCIFLRDIDSNITSFLLFQFQLSLEKLFYNYRER
jgi:hypothetical protein